MKRSGRRAALTNAHPTRREWLRWVALASASLQVTGCGDNALSNPPPRDVTAIVLEPTEQSFVVAVWSEHNAVAQVTVEESLSGLTIDTRAITIAGTTNAYAMFTGLPSAMRYRVFIEFASGITLGPYVVMTRPPRDANVPLRLAVTADIDPSPAYSSSIFSTLATFAPDLSVCLGDFPYADNGPNLAMTVAAYRSVHAFTRSDPHVQTWLRSSALCAIYDDHEFRNDWAPRFVSSEADRYAAAMQVWDEFFPLPGAAPEIRYRTWQWGRQVEGFMLDCRRFRSEPRDPDGPAKTMLGQTQKQWFLQQIIASQAACKLVFISVPLDFGTGAEHWDVYAHERNEIFAALAAADVRGVLFFSGDQHWFAAHRHSNGAREFQIGPVARGVREPPPLRPEVLARALDYNFGAVEIADGRISFNAIDSNGSSLYSETLDAAALRIGT